MDIRVELPDHTEHRQRRRAPLSSKSAAQRWGETREREWYAQLTSPQAVNAAVKEVPTLAEFAPRFLDGHARANRHKPSGIAAQESILKWHLIPALGANHLDAITNERVQKLKLALVDRAPKTVNNVLTVLSTLLKKAVEWGTEDALRLLDGRQSGLEPLEKFGDILDTREAATGSTCERGSSWSGLRGSKPIRRIF